MTQVEYFIGPAQLVVSSVFMMGTCMDLGSFSRCIFNAHVFFSLMKHMWAPLSKSTIMVSFFSSYTFQIRVTGILISFIPHGHSCGALAFYSAGVSSVSRKIERGLCFSKVLILVDESRSLIIEVTVWHESVFIECRKHWMDNDL